MGKIIYNSIVKLLEDCLFLVLEEAESSLGGPVGKMSNFILLKAYDRSLTFMVIIWINRILNYEKIQNYFWVEFSKKNSGCKVLLCVLIAVLKSIIILY